MSTSLARVSAKLSLALLVLTFMLWCLVRIMPAQAEMRAPEIVRTATDTAQPISDPVLARINEKLATEIENGLPAQVRECLARYKSVFRAIEKRSGVPMELLVGVATIESGGCSLPKNGPGNITHITLVDDRHRIKAAEFAKTTPEELNELESSFDAVAITAAVLRDYKRRTDTGLTGIMAYERGPGNLPDDTTTPNRYARRVLTAAAFARRILNKEPIVDSDGIVIHVTADELPEF